MIRKLTINNLKQYNNLRLISLKNDPLSWLSTYKTDAVKQDYFFHYKFNYYPPQSIFGYWGFFENNQLLGYIQLADSTLYKKRHTAYIYDLCVDPKFRHKSIGSQLIKHVIGKAKSVSEIEQIYLYVNSKNLLATKFYKKLGFNKIAALPQAVKESDGSYQDELIFQITL